ncbi:hypothetical protein RHIZ404_200008 [Rhizobium sp. EC-SD404]|nr:hypothetical protein RHIZ404_200008 [Rhizobium sp. EC-SD404]
MAKRCVSGLSVSSRRLAGYVKTPMDALRTRDVTDQLSASLCERADIDPAHVIRTNQD